MNSLLGTQSGVPHLITPACKFSNFPTLSTHLVNPACQFTHFPHDFFTLNPTHLNLDPCNNRVSASVNVVGEHLELAGEDCNLRELLLLPLHNVRLVLREPGGGGNEDNDDDNDSSPVKEVVDDVSLEDFHPFSVRHLLCVSLHLHCI